MVANPLDEEAIFRIACRITSGEVRSDYLQQACGDNQRLLERVRTLLRLHDQNESFLERPVGSVAATMDVPSIAERPGTQIGPYKLIEVIGEGGMGIVYAAAQKEPIRRKVAIKVIKPGMDSKAVVARFEAERQALAMMDHPNIAKVLDAGTNESGRPYFAMELVRGIPITDYCDQNKLTICERQVLFIQVCRAIQHAHHKGIIHRDIKPSNVLVTLHDGTPVPKVIDFGVAKALDARLTDHSIYTGHLQVIGTLLYMSPEQAELSGLDIDTRSDVYSLGVLLYELLTGTTPFQKKELDEAAFDEQRRIIREKDPPRASVRISSLGETATSVAAHRQTDAKRLRQQVRGDLDWIVLKALEKDRTRRYDTPAGMAQDVERHLANEPVVACPPSFAYRLRKYWRRNRLALTATLLVAASLGIGFSVSVWKTWEAVQHLRAYRDLTFKHTMNAAILGDKEFLDALVQADNVDIPEEWRCFLQGLVHFYDGHLEDAADDFEQSLEIEDNNMAACALLSICYAWCGDWPRVFSCRDRLNSMSPREGYEEYDQAFNSLFDIYREADTARFSLAKFLDKHPNAALARLFHAIACVHSVFDSGDLELARMNVERNVVVIEELLGDNPLAQFVSLVSYTVLFQLDEQARDSSTSVRARADRLEAGMHAEHFVMTHLARAMYLNVVGEDEAALRKWRACAQMNYSTPVYIAEALRLGNTDEVVEFLKNTGEMLDSTDSIVNDLWKEAGEATDKAVKLPDAGGVDVLVRLGDRETSQDATLQTEPHKLFYFRLSFSHLANPPRTKQFLEGTVTAEDLIADAGSSRIELAKAYYLIGLEHMAEGRPTAARENLAKVVEQGQITWPIHYTAKMLCERIGE